MYLISMYYNENKHFPKESIFIIGHICVDPWKADCMDFHLITPILIDWALFVYYFYFERLIGQIVNLWITLFLIYYELRYHNNYLERKF